MLNARKPIAICLALQIFTAADAFADTDTRDSQSPFGVLDFLAWDHDWNRHHYPPEKIERAAALMEEAGVGFVRMDFLWTDIEPEEGVFDFKKYDEIVDLLSKKNIKILGLLNYNAQWSAENWNDAPNPRLYLKYAEQVVQRYRDRIKYWEIWNEPDYKAYWQPQDDMKSYTSLLKEAYTLLKKADPSCKVVLGGLSQSVPIQLKRIYRLGGKDSFDVVNIHAFTDPLSPQGLSLMKGIYLGTRKQMIAAGDESKPIWITEVGCPGNDASDRPGWWLGSSPNEEEQAQWVETVYREALRWEGVEKVFWAFFRDTPDHFKGGGDHLGLLREDFSKKPAFESYKKAARK